MRNQFIIGIICVMLAAIGIACAEDPFVFSGTYGDTFVTGQVTFDENGVINSGMIAGVSNGDMDVAQSSCQGSDFIIVGQAAEIQGDSGFAGTLVDDGNGNQGGNFASFTGGSMDVGQMSGAGATTFEYPEYDSQGYSGSPWSIPFSGILSLEGVFTVQDAMAEGSSGYASSQATTNGGDSAQTTASFTNGGFAATQGAAGGQILFISQDWRGSSANQGFPLYYPDTLTGNGAIAGQIVEMGGDSGSASTTASNGAGASAQTSTSFTNGEMDAIQAGGAGNLALTIPYDSASGRVSTPLFVPTSCTADGAIAGQQARIFADTGSASTTASNGAGASAQTSAAFVDGRMSAFQAGGAGDVSLTMPNYYASTEIPIPVEPMSLSAGGAIAGQEIAMEGSSGSAATTVSNGNGASGRSSASFTNGGMGTMQAGGAGDVSLAMPNYYTVTDSPVPGQVNLSMGGVIIGQMVEELEGDSGSASTMVANGNGASGQTTSSFSSGAIDYLIQAGGTGDLSLESPLSLIYPPLDEYNVSVGAAGLFAGQYGDMQASSGSASTSVTDVNGANAGNSISFTDGFMDYSQVSAGITDLELGISGTPLISGSDLPAALSFQNVEFGGSSITATSYSGSAGNSQAQVIARSDGGPVTQAGPVTTSSNFKTTQFAGSITAGSLDLAVAGQNAEITGSGFANGIASDSNGNTALVTCFVNSGNLAAGDSSYIPTGILVGAGDLGGTTGAIAAHTDMSIAGNSGGVSATAENSTGGYAFVHSAFSVGSLDTGNLGGAVSGQSGDSHALGAMELDVGVTGLDTIIQTGTAGSYAYADTPGLYDAYSLDWPGGFLGDPPISEIIP